MEMYHGNFKNFGEFLYSPHDFLLFTWGNSIKIKYDYDTLEKLESMINHGKLTCKRLEKRGWEIREVKVGDSYVKEFRGICFDGSRKAIEDSVMKIFDSVVLNEDNYTSPLDAVNESEAVELLTGDFNDWWKLGISDSD